jgi:replicative DNA helicase
MLGASDFARPAHRTAWSVVCQLDDEGGPVDAVTLLVAHADRDLLDEVGGAGALAYLTSAEACPSAASWATYGRLVAREGRRRRLRTVLRRALAALDGGADPSVLADELTRQVAA